MFLRKFSAMIASKGTCVAVLKVKGGLVIASDTRSTSKIKEVGKGTVFHEKVEKKKFLANLKMGPIEHCATFFDEEAKECMIAPMVMGLGFGTVQNTDILIRILKVARRAYWRTCPTWSLSFINFFRQTYTLWANPLLGQMIRGRYKEFYGSILFIDGDPEANLGGYTVSPLTLHVGWGEPGEIDFCLTSEPHLTLEGPFDYVVKGSGADPFKFYINQYLEQSYPMYLNETIEEVCKAMKYTASLVPTVGGSVRIWFFCEESTDFYFMKEVPIYGIMEAFLDNLSEECPERTYECFYTVGKRLRRLMGLSFCRRQMIANACDVSGLYHGKATLLLSEDEDEATLLSEDEDEATLLSEDEAI